MYHACSPSNENIFLTPAWSSAVRNSIQKPTLQAEMLVWVHTHDGVMLVIFFFVNLIQIKVIWEEKTSTEKKYLQ